MPSELYCDIAVLTCLCIARYVFNYPCIEFYIPARLARFLEPADLPSVTSGWLPTSLADHDSI